MESILILKDKESYVYDLLNSEMSHILHGNEFDNFQDFFEYLFDGFSKFDEEDLLSEFLSFPYELCEFLFYKCKINMNKFDKFHFSYNERFSQKYIFST